MLHLKRWLAGIISVILTVRLAKWLGLEIKWDSEWYIIVFVPVLAILNAVVGPVLKLLAIPLTCLTFGLFTFVINGLVFWLAISFTGGQTTFWTAVFGSICVTIISGPISWALGANRENDD